MEAGAVLAGKYQLETLLGRGGMGSVWRAMHLGLHAPVAIKLIDATIMMNPEAIARFHREARAAAGLRSPHVVQILDHGVDEATRTPFIAMELMEGESLAQRLQRVQRLSPAETARIITHVARALARAHEGGIVHRDLKPDNIFLIRNEDEEIAKVLDFGIAKSQATLGTDSATRTGAVMGTPYYMSPEQISGAKNVDFRTDLWALGVIACECMTAHRPFDAESIGGLTLKICVEPVPRPSSFAPMPPGFDAWFERAVARVPTARFASARELADELRRVCGGDASISGQVVGAPTPGGSTSGVARSGVVTSGVPAASAPSMSAMSTTSRDDVPAGVSSGRATLWLAVTGLLAVLGGSAGAWFLLRTPPAEDAASAASSPSSVVAAPTVTAEAPVAAPPVEPVAIPAPVVAPAPPATPSASPPAVAVAPVVSPPRTSTKVTAKPKPAAPAATVAPKPVAAAPAPAPAPAPATTSKAAIDARSVINSRR